MHMKALMFLVAPSVVDSLFFLARDMINLNNHLNNQHTCIETYSLFRVS